jgi:hypothetical protein
MQSVDTTIVAQIEGLQKEIRWSQQKALIELFFSSFGIVFWMGGTVLEKGILGPRIIGLALVFPLAVNITMWALWALWPFYGTMTSRVRPEDLDYGIAEDARAAYMEYDALRYRLHRIRTIGRYIDLLTAIQFILMATLLAYSLLHVF